MWKAVDLYLYSFLPRDPEGAGVYAREVGNEELTDLWVLIFRAYISSFPRSSLILLFSYRTSACIELRVDIAVFVKS